jgi:SAM-dependent methyltransferase
MNLYHRWYCGSGRWAKRLEGGVLGWAVRDTDLGEHPLEVGPGPGLVTDLLRQRVPRLTSLEIDHRLATSLAKRLEGTNVRVVEGDGTAMPFEDGEFTGAVSLFMLHHVPTAELQDRLFREVCRVIKPGATFVGADSTPSLSWRAAHILDTCRPVNPKTIEDRLRRAGFIQIRLSHTRGAFRFEAKRPPLLVSNVAAVETAAVSSPTSGDGNRLDRVPPTGQRA